MNAKIRDSISKPPLVLDAALSEQLEDLAQRSIQRLPDVAKLLLEEVGRADVRPAGELPPDVVTIGSEVTFRDDTNTVRTVQLVYPRNADIDAGRVSVLTPIGAALIGLSEGQTIGWEASGGKLRELTVIAVSQP